MEHTSAYINCQEPDCVIRAVRLLTCKETMVESNSSKFIYHVEADTQRWPHGYNQKQGGRLMTGLLFI